MAILKKESIIDFIKQNGDYLYSEYSIVKIGLIGSFARDEQNEDSDIDLLVEFKPDTEDLATLKSSLKQYFKKHFNRDVDICREKYMKPYVKNYILNEVLYA
jgi:uncharacterized protein